MSERAQLACIVAALVVERVRASSIPYMPLPWVLGMMRTARAERAAAFDAGITWWDPTW